MSDKLPEGIPAEWADESAVGGSSSQTDTLKNWAAVFWIAACVIGALGIYQLCNESKIVGGDAYNFMIGATRGVGLIALGVLLAVQGCALLLFAIRGEIRLSAATPLTEIKAAGNGERDQEAEGP